LLLQGAFAGEQRCRLPFTTHIFAKHNAPAGSFASALALPLTRKARKAPKRQEAWQKSSKQ
jgi:hypothetical protein